MYHHFLFIHQLATAINERLLGATLSSCFSQNKDELIMIFDNQFVIKADLRPETSLLSFPTEFARAKKNSANIFPELIGKKVISVASVKWDRSFRIHFDDSHNLVVKLYGRRSNILHFFKGSELKLFRTELGQDQLLNLDQYETTKSWISALPKEHELNQILGTQMMDFLNSRGLMPISQESIDLMVNLPIYVQTEPKLNLTYWENQDSSEKFDDPILASNRFYHQFTNSVLFEKERDKIRNEFNQKIKQSKSYIDKATEKLRQLQSRRSYREIADLIMANLHLFREDQSEVELYDFYKDQQLKVKIKPNITPQKHAENLYRKSKNESLEAQKIKDNIERKKQELALLEVKYNEIENAQSWKAIKPLTAQSSSTPKQVEQLPYLVFNFDEYEIRVGKDARRNDQLTTQYSAKDDLWLHAKDVAGSHVVIKNPTKKKIPKQVIEFAAGLAAYYSKRKHDTLCPVLYTERKYVRKSKKLAPGQVIVEREEVLLVPPHDPKSKDYST